MLEEKQGRPFLVSFEGLCQELSVAPVAAPEPYFQALQIQEQLANFDLERLFPSHNEGMEPLSEAVQQE